MDEQVSLTVRLPREFYEKLKEATQRRGLRMASLIKQLLNDWLRENS